MDEEHVFVDEWNVLYIDVAFVHDVKIVLYKSKGNPNIVTDGCSASDVLRSH